MEQLEASLQIAERPVKLLIKSYFNIFDSKSEPRFGKPIPKEYKIHKSMIQMMTMMPSVWNSNTLFVIPKKCGMISIPEPYNWSFYLDIVPRDTIWDAEFVDSLPDQEELKKQIGNMLRDAMIIFDYLKRKHSELANLSMYSDPNNLTLFIRDNYLEIEHGDRIGIKFVKN